MLSDEEKKDILFQIDMQLYDEFNHKFCEINDNLGIVYSYKDLDDLEKAEKETEIRLLRQAIEKQQKEIEELKNADLTTVYLNGVYDGEKKVQDKIKAEIEEIDEEIKVKREIAKNPMDRVAGRLLTDSIVELEKTKKVLQSFLEKE